MLDPADLGATFGFTANIVKTSFCCWLPKKGWSGRMETDVDGGYPALCNAGDAQPVHHTAAHLLGEAVLALLPWLDARARVNESIADAGAEVNMLMLEVDEA